MVVLMNVQDFFSIVQLGIGIHAGTAILQISGEFGVAPVERRVAAMESWIRQEKERGFELEGESDKLALVRVDLILFKANYDHLYTRSVYGTFAFGGLLTLMLAGMSFFAQAEICLMTGLMIVGLSVLPALVIFGRLWWKSSGALAPIETKVKVLESRVKSPDA